MAIIVEANYSKKLGLPQYSSHQFSVSVRTELSNLEELESECGRLYQSLQDSVDREIRQTGWMPGESNAEDRTIVPANEWGCSPKQKDLIQKIAEENSLGQKLPELAESLYGRAVEKLNKLQASGLIDELLDQYGAAGGNGKSGGQKRVPASRGNRRFERRF